MIRTTLLILVGLLAFAAGLVARMPATVVAEWAESNIPGLMLSGVSGTALDGRVARALYRDLPLQDISWEVQPWQLLLGQANVEVHVATDTDGFEATVSRPLLGGDITISNLTGSASVGWLARRFGYTFIPVTGQLTVQLHRVVVSTGAGLKAAHGRLSVSGLRWELIKPPAPLGSVRVKVTTEADAIIAHITHSDGPLAVAGSARLQPGGRYRVNIRLRPRPEADRRLQELLSELGNADSDGWYRIAASGRL